MDQNLNSTSNPLDSFVLPIGQPVPQSLNQETSGIMLTPFFAPLATNYGSNLFLPHNTLPVCHQPATLSAAFPRLDMLGMQQLLGASSFASSSSHLFPRGFNASGQMISIPQRASHMPPLLSQVNTSTLVGPPVDLQIDLSAQKYLEEVRGSEEFEQHHVAASSYSPPSNRSAFFPVDQSSGLSHKRSTTSLDILKESLDRKAKSEDSSLSSAYVNRHGQAKSGGGWGKVEEGSTSGRHKPWKIALTESQAQDIFMQRPKIKELYGFGSSQLGEKYMVNAKTIRDIWNRETWVKATKHLWTSEEIMQDAAERERKRFKSSCTDDEAAGSGSKKN
ncbi:hypothetical protein GUITHDRAFT_110505 [Guillardia theta CCMP2712]|uniref:Uncharacterized protein n=1 Tax=Guillardia theta (strain CCMP2712) TaxID=905079 RepID=L1J5I8_GUITC|nr:hypothetical protein GUITHDRAFT_110505 [Guillardia theta CCMP2712]EKX43384.1 hypothetical protein GUITHDRAFT_110505 [Guillardia theta CCMP2712]|eukprot:XP_005830364.1 hypothetical protein GUITHDRAFT_110505 [Guillardia theta CCMP2712]